MNRRISIFCMCFLGSFFFQSCSSDTLLIEDESITIYRDEWGVPHIHAPTDEQVAYGLAWAQCEDDFVTIQEQMLAIQGRLGELKGKDGITADFGILFMRLRERAAQDYHLLSPKVKQILEHYAAAVNAFGKAHKEEILLDNNFHVRPQDLVAGYMLGMVEISGAGKDLQKIINGNVVPLPSEDIPRGSNAIALSSKRTTTGETFLAINSHQPLEGWYSWYEAHLISDEGTNILGGTFPGGATIFHGVNENLAWAHTVNHADFSDIYQLQMHADKKDFYLIDGEYKKLIKSNFSAWLKVWGPLKIPIWKKAYLSDFGPTFKTDQGVFAWKFSAGDASRAVEQWYMMNRAGNWSEFKEALALRYIPCTNIVYADKEDNIFYLSNGHLPIRDPQYNWKEVLPGTEDRLAWKEGFWPIDSLPQVLNPLSGYVFNTNNTPFNSSDSLSQPRYEARFIPMGYMPPAADNNRSLRLAHLLEADTSISYEEFKAIKFDRQYPTSLKQVDIINLELLLQLSPRDYEDIADAINVLKKWNRRTDPENEQALLFLLSLQELRSYLQRSNRTDLATQVSALDCADALRKAKDKMLSTYQTLEIPLGQIQRHIRGNKDLPVGGGSDVLAAIYATSMPDGRYRAYSGESYIELVRFSADGEPQIQSIHAYGSSAEPDSPHYSDQMEKFVNQELKDMTLSLDQVKSTAVRSYHPRKKSSK